MEAVSIFHLTMLWPARPKHNSQRAAAPHRAPLPPLRPLATALLLMQWLNEKLAGRALALPNGRGCCAAGAKLPGVATEDSAEAGHILFYILLL